MTEWKARRFWAKAQARRDGAGWGVFLDERPLRTPGKLPLILPAQALAAAIAEEWDAQGDVIDPLTMPLTRAANSAIEKVTPQFADVVDLLAGYGRTDLLCYRAQDPTSLIELQAEAWDPLIAWARDELNAPLRVTQGVMPIEQEITTLETLRAHVAALDVFGLTALHDLVTLPGSLILGLAVIRGRLDAAQAFDLSRIDERFQAERWGRDDLAEQAAASRLEAMRAAEKLWMSSRPEH